jgi:hypothetical protein
MYINTYIHREEQYDDVVMKEEKEDVIGESERIDLSQERSRVGLGEVCVIKCMHIWL